MGSLVCACMNSTHKKNIASMSSVVIKYRWVDRLNCFRPAIPFYYTRAHRIPYFSDFNKHKSLFHGHTVLLCLTECLSGASSHVAALPALTKLRLGITFKVIAPSTPKWPPYAGDGSTVRPGQKVQAEKVIMEGRREGDEVRKYKEHRGWGGGG